LPINESSTVHYELDSFRKICSKPSIIHKNLYKNVTLSNSNNCLPVKMWSDWIGRHAIISIFRAVWFV